MAREPPAGGGWQLRTGDVGVSRQSAMLLDSSSTRSVNRSGFDAVGLPLHARLGARLVIPLARRFPPLFFVFVLGGEEPIDYVQRKVLREENDLPPVIERVMRIHVTEEARHLSFARSYLKSHAATLTWYDRLRLGIGAPIILSVMTAMMFRPSPQLVAKYGIPKVVLAEAYTNNPATKADDLAAIRRVHKLCAEVAPTRITRPIGDGAGRC